MQLSDDDGKAMSVFTYGDFGPGADLDLLWGACLQNHNQ